MVLVFAFSMRELYYNCTTLSMGREDTEKPVGETFFAPEKILARQRDAWHLIDHIQT